MRAKKKNMTAKYCLLQGGYWTLAAVAMAYTTPILQAKGYTGTEIGIISAVKYASVLVFQMVLGAFSDRHAKTFPLKYLLVLLTGISMVFAWIFWGTGHNMPVAILVFIVFGATVNCASPLVDSMSIQYMNNGYEMNYTLSRGCGSLTWAVFCVIVGRISDVFGSNQILLFQLLMSLVFIGTALFMDRIEFREETGADVSGAVPPADEAETDVSLTETDEQLHADTAEVSSVMSSDDVMKSGDASKSDAPGVDFTVHTTGYLVKHYPKFNLFLIAVTLIFMGYSMNATFLINRIEELGGTHTDYGIAEFVLAMAEIPVALWFYRMRKHMRLDTMMLLCPIFCTLRAAATAFAPTVLLLILAQGLEILGLSIYYAGSVFYVMDYLPPQDCVKGTSLINLAGMGLGEMLGSIICGYLKDAYGLQFLMNVSVLVSICGIGFMFAMTRVSGEKRAG